MEVTIGIDIGGTNSRVGLVDKEGNVIKSQSISTTQYPVAEEFIRALDHLIVDILKPGREEYDLKGIGVGAPNANYHRGTIENAPNLPWKGIVPFKEIFQSYRNVPFALTNDANAAAIGEKMFGVAKYFENFVILTLGTGLGSGIILNGELLYGHTGFAGEMGHLIMVPGGRECGCGQQGCLETYVSATGICRTAIELLAKRKGESPLRKFKMEDLTSKHISDAAEQGDLIALEAFDKTAEMLALAIVNTMAFASLEAVVLFGGFARSGDLLMKPLSKWVDKYILVFFRNTFEILFSTVKEDHAAILGASALAWREVAKVK